MSFGSKYSRFPSIYYIAISIASINVIYFISPSYLTLYPEVAVVQVYSEIKSILLGRFIINFVLQS